MADAKGHLFRLVDKVMGMSSPFGVGTPKTPAKESGSEAPTPVPREAIKVCLRVRPLSMRELARGERSCVVVQNDTTVQVLPAKPTRGRSEATYSFTRVFGEAATQKDVFEFVALPLFRDALEGRNALLFTYGSTNSGKTHTMQGTDEDPGVLVRGLDVVFNTIGDNLAEPCVISPDGKDGITIQTPEDARAEHRRRKRARVHFDEEEVAGARRRRSTSVALEADADSAYAVFVSYMELYNEQIFDLLDDSRKRTARKLKSHEGRPQHQYVEGLTEVEVRSTAEACAVLARGQRNRQVASTGANSESSRSHAIFALRIVRAPLDAHGEHVIADPKYASVSRLALVDLAGSERNRKTGSSGDRQAEANAINQSMLALSNCMRALRSIQGGRRGVFVPFRDSLLTTLFRRHFEGEGRVAVIVCANPSASDHSETVHTLGFSEVAQSISTATPKPKVRKVGLAEGRGQARKMVRRAQQAVDDASSDEDESSSSSDDDGGAGEGAGASDAPADAHGKSERRAATVLDYEGELFEGMEPETASMVIRRMENAPYSDEELIAMGSKEIQKYIAFMNSIQDKRIRKQAAELAQKEDRFRQRLAEYSDEMERLRKLAREHDALVHAVKVEREKYAGEVAALVEKLDALRESLADKDDAIRETLRRCDAAEGEQLRLKEKLADALSANAQLHDANDKLHKQLADAEAAREADRRQLQSALVVELKKHKEELEKRMCAAASADFEALTRKIAHEKEARVELAGRLAALQGELAACGSLEALEKHCASLAEKHSAPKDEDKENGGRPALQPSAPFPYAAGEGHRLGKGPAGHVLEHVPGTIVETNTVLTPRLRNKTTTSSPTVEALVGRRVLGVRTAKGADAYVLRNQTRDGDTIQTQIFKGKVKKSITGSGATVLFTGIETMTDVAPDAQRPADPGDEEPHGRRGRKRKSDGDRAADGSDARGKRCRRRSDGDEPSECSSSEGDDRDASDESAGARSAASVKARCAVGIQSSETGLPSMVHKVVDRPSRKLKRK